MQKKIKSILIVDDSEDNQVLLKLLLQGKGYHVYSAPNGLKALEILLQMSFLPELILLDIQMPVMDGYQFRNEQINHQQIKNIPVVVMSADHNAKIQEKMHFPIGFMKKPLCLEEINRSLALVMDL